MDWLGNVVFENRVRFPKWPCFTFLDPIGRAPELRRGKWPELFGSVVVDELHNQPPSTVALTKYAPAVAKKLETTPEELRAVIERFDCFAGTSKEKTARRYGVMGVNLSATRA